MAAGSHNGFCVGMLVILDHPRSAIMGRSLIYKFGVDRIYSFGNIAILRYRRFALALPIYIVISPRMRRIRDKFTSRVKLSLSWG